LINFIAEAYGSRISPEIPVPKIPSTIISALKSKLKKVDGIGNF